MRPQVIQVRSENNLYQHVEVLKRNRVKRRRYGEFFVEGVIPIERALEHGWGVKYCLYSAEVRLSKWAQDILARSRAQAHLELTPELMGQLSDKEEPSELLAILEMPENDLSRIPVEQGSLVVVLDRPSNHGNLGTIIRSCDALNAGGLVMTGHGVDLYDPRTIRASVGSLFALPVVRLASYRDLIPWIDSLKVRAGDLQVIGTSAKAAVDIVDVDLTRTTILIVGNETRGLSANYRALCDSVVRIPMRGSATSLNVACATSILLYEADRQREGLETQVA
jgi:TrmH family RNA methyltransferase